MSRDTVEGPSPPRGRIDQIRGQGSQVVKEKPSISCIQPNQLPELVKGLGLRSKTNVVSLDKIIIDKNLR